MDSLKDMIYSAHLDSEADVETVIDTEYVEDFDKPRLYKVIFTNDDYTPINFVINLLTTIFRKSNEEAAKITLDIHMNGIGVVA